MPRRVLQGTVTNNKSDKTVIVRVESQIIHPIYKKYIRRSKKYAAHDPDNKCQIGENVRIVESRPISKSKKWCVLFDDQAKVSG